MTMSATFRRDVEALGEVFQLVDAFFSREALSPRFRFPVDLALEEIFTNFVKYNAASPSTIGVSLRRDRDELVVSITDFEAEPFDPTAAPAAAVAAPIETRAPGGLGIHLVNQVMDRVEYQRGGTRSTITLYKRLD